MERWGGGCATNVSTHGEVNDYRVDWIGGGVRGAVKAGGCGCAVGESGECPSKCRVVRTEQVQKLTKLAMQRNIKATHFPQTVRENRASLFPKF